MIFRRHRSNKLVFERYDLYQDNTPHRQHFWKEPTLFELAQATLVIGYTKENKAVVLKNRFGPAGPVGDM